MAGPPGPVDVHREAGTEWAGWGLVWRLSAFALAFAALFLLATLTAWDERLFFPNWWPAGGVALGTLLLAPARIWPAILLVLAGTWAALVSVWTPPGLVEQAVPLRIAANVVGPLTGATLVRLVRPGTLCFQRLRDVGLVLCAGPIAGGAVAVAILTLTAGLVDGGASSFSALFTWSGSVLGGFVGTALVLTLPARGEKWLGGNGVAEALLLFLFLCLASWAAFDMPFVDGHVAQQIAEQGGRLALAGALFLLLAWGALRFGPRGAAWSAFLLTTLGTWFTRLGYGPFGLAEEPSYRRLAYAETFFGMATVAALVMAAVAAERSRALARKRLLLEVGYVLARRDPLAARLQEMARAIAHDLADACVIRLRGLEVAHPQAVQPFEGARGQQWYGAPIGQEEERGTLFVRAPRQFGTFDADDRATAQLLAEQLADMLAQDSLRETIAEEVGRSTSLLAMLDALIGGSPVAVAIFDADGRILRVNPAFAALDEVELEAHPGRSPAEVLGEQGRRFEEVLGELRASGRSVTGVQLRLETMEAKAERWLASTWFPIGGGAGGPHLFGAFFLDVTEQRAAEAERVRLLEETRAALRLRDDFLTVAAHELKTPITPLAVRLQRMRRAVERGEPVDRRSLDKSLESLERLKDLMGALLDVERVRAVSSTLEKHPVDWVPVVAAASERFRRRPGPHLLEVSLPAAPVVVAADEARLTQVVLALVDNAFKFSPAGGRVRVALVASGGQARLSVSDEGIGIPAEDRPHVFDRFARSSNAPIDSFGGLGLSLFTSRGVVELLGGTLSVESELGRGSTFVASLPLAQSPPPSAA